jgi:hypothetical protein
VSHPTPLHPDADLAVVLDDMRQDVAAWGDEGLVMRFFRASICLMLLSILDTLIELLADFRAGRLPAVLPAYDETPDERAAPPPPAPADPVAASRRSAASRHTSAPRADDPCATAADAPERSDAVRPVQAPCRLISFGPAPRLPIRHPDHRRRGTVFYPSHVPRWPSAAFGEIAAPQTHADFVAVSYCSGTIPRTAIPARRR